jgi:SAM-dependent methyltransferase
VHGIELSQYASEYARTRLGLSVHTGTVEDADFPTEYFDVITLWDVLEHLPDPMKALRILWRWLKPEGLLLLNTPNLDSLDARVFGVLDWLQLRVIFMSSRALSVHCLQTDSDRECRLLVRQLCCFRISIRFWLAIRPQFPMATSG